MLLVMVLIALEGMTSSSEEFLIKVIVIVGLCYEMVQVFSPIRLCVGMVAP